MFGPILTTKEAAVYCGLAEQSLRDLMSQGVGPVYYKHGKKNAFRHTDLDEWLESRLVRMSSPIPQEKGERAPSKGTAPLILIHR